MDGQQQKEKSNCSIQFWYVDSRRLILLLQVNSFITYLLSGEAGTEVQREESAKPLKYKLLYSF